MPQGVKFKFSNSASLDLQLRYATINSTYMYSHGHFASVASRPHSYGRSRSDSIAYAFTMSCRSDLLPSHTKRRSQLTFSTRLLSCADWHPDGFCLG